MKMQDVETWLCVFPVQMHLGWNSDSVFLKGPALQTLPGSCLQVCWQGQSGEWKIRVLGDPIESSGRSDISFSFGIFLTLGLFSVFAASVPPLSGVGVRRRRRPLQPALPGACSTGGQDWWIPGAPHSELRPHLHFTLKKSVHAGAKRPEKNTTFDIRQPLLYLGIKNTINIKALHYPIEVPPHTHIDINTHTLLPPVCYLYCCWWTSLCIFASKHNLQTLKWLTFLLKSITRAPQFISSNSSTSWAFPEEHFGPFLRLD